MYLATPLWGTSDDDTRLENDPNRPPSQKTIEMKAAPKAPQSSSQSNDAATPVDELVMQQGPKRVTPQVLSPFP